MAGQAAVVGLEVISFPFVYLWDVEATSGGAGTKVNLWVCPAGKKIKKAKVWIHSLTDNVKFGFGDDDITDDITPTFTNANIPKTSTVNIETEFIETENHLDLLVGGGDAEDFFLEYATTNETGEMGISLFVEDV